VVNASPARIEVEDGRERPERRGAIEGYAVGFTHTKVQQALDAAGIKPLIEDRG
jgi:hypothetical protein